MFLWEKTVMTHGILSGNLLLAQSSGVAMDVFPRLSSTFLLFPVHEHNAQNTHHSTFFFNENKASVAQQLCSQGLNHLNLKHSTSCVKTLSHYFHFKTVLCWNTRSFDWRQTEPDQWRNVLLYIFQCFGVYIMTHCGLQLPPFFSTFFVCLLLGSLFYFYYGITLNTGIIGENTGGLASSPFFLLFISLCMYYCVHKEKSSTHVLDFAFVMCKIFFFFRHTATFSIILGNMAPLVLQCSQTAQWGNVVVLYMCHVEKLKP